MYIIRPVPVTSCPERWLAFSSVTITSPASVQPPYDYPTWSPTVSTDSGEVKSAMGYDFVSLVDNNDDNPVYNYVGRMPRSNDSVTGIGKDTWIRRGVSNRFACFVPNAAGYTVINGQYQAYFTPSLISNDIKLKMGWKEKLVTLVNGVIGSSLTMQTLDPDLNSLGGDTKPMTPSGEAGWFFNPEIPSTARSFIYQNDFSHNATLYSSEEEPIAQMQEILIDPVENPDEIEGHFDRERMYVENIFMGRMSYLGISQWDGYKNSVNDYSKLEIDDYGVVSVSRRRISRETNVRVVIQEETGRTILDKLNYANRLLLSCRGQICAFLLTNNNLQSIDDFTLTEIPYRDVVICLLKDFTISDISKGKAVITISISSIPSGFDLMSI